MAQPDTCYWLDPRSLVYFVDSPTAPTIHLRDADGQVAALHLNVGELHGESGRQDAIAVLDALAGAVIAAYKALQARAPQTVADAVDGPADQRHPSWLDGGVCRGCGCDTAQDNATRAGDRRGCACACHSGEPLNFDHLGSDEPIELLTPDDDGDDNDDAAHELVAPVGAGEPCARQGCGHPRRSHDGGIEVSWCVECPCIIYVPAFAPVAAENDLRALAGDR